MKNRALLTATLTACLGAGLHADAATITYVDAVEGASGNTFATASGDLTDTSWVGANNGNSLDNGWRKRSTFANGGTIFQGRYDDDGADFPELTTQITGLSDGLYDVWVFFWDPDDQTWNIAAGLTSDSLTTYSFDGAGNTAATVAAGDLDFTTTVLTAEGNRTMYGVNIGQATVSGGSTIDVFIDNLTGGQLPGSVGGGDRTWYDGVGYEVVPEPSSLALLALGGLLIARRRRS